MKSTNHYHTLKNVVLISLDCVRPEALGCYPQRFPLRVRIPPGENTHNIDYLAAHGHRFDQVITPAPFTPAAHASLFTGLIPPEHGIRTMFGSKLRDETITIAEYLSSKGWRCGAVVSSGTLDHEFGLSKGFEYYDDDIQTGNTNWLAGERREAVEVTNRAINWLRSNSNDRFFLFVHYFDAHTVHDFDPHIIAESENSGNNIERAHSLPGISKLRPVIWKIRSSTIDYFEIGLPYFIYSRYGRRYMLRQVNKIDRQIGRLLQTLSELDRLEETLIIITADHGEDFREHGELDHRLFLYDTTLRVPMVIYPKIGDRPVIEQQVSLIDVFPSIISILGLDPIGVDIQGLSFEALTKNESTGNNAFQSRPTYAETVWESPPPGKVELRTVYAALRYPTWKLIWDRLHNTYELYNLEKDPGEVINQYQAYPLLAADWVEQLKHQAQEMPLNSDDEANKMIFNRLKSLGYI